MIDLALEDGEHEIRRRVLAGADHPHRAGLPAGGAVHRPLTNQNLVHAGARRVDQSGPYVLTLHLPLANQSLVHDVLTNQGLPVGRLHVTVHMPLTNQVAEVLTN